MTSRLLRASLMKGKREKGEAGDCNRTRPYSWRRRRSRENDTIQKWLQLHINHHPHPARREREPENRFRLVDMSTSSSASPLESYRSSSSCTLSCILTIEKGRPICNIVSWSNVSVCERRSLTSSRTEPTRFSANHPELGSPPPTRHHSMSIPSCYFQEPENYKNQ